MAVEQGVEFVAPAGDRRAISSNPTSIPASIRRRSSSKIRRIAASSPRSGWRSNHAGAAVREIGRDRPRVGPGIDLDRMPVGRPVVSAGRRHLGPRGRERSGVGGRRFSDRGDVRFPGRGDLVGPASPPRRVEFRPRGRPDPAEKPPVFQQYDGRAGPHRGPGTGPFARRHCWSDPLDPGKMHALPALKMDAAIRPAVKPPGIPARPACSCGRSPRPSRSPRGRSTRRPRRRSRPTTTACFDDRPRLNDFLGLPPANRRRQPDRHACPPPCRD